MAMVGWITLRERSVWPLVAGDVAAFVVFAALGHRDHGESGSMISIVGTALPFIGGWLAVAPWAGVYELRRQFSVRSTLRVTALGWLAAWPAGLLLRGLVLHRGIPVSFAVVALCANMVLLVGWRALYFQLRTRRGA